MEKRRIWQVDSLCLSREVRLRIIFKGIINLICYTIYYYIRQMNQTKLVFWGSNSHNLLSSSHHKSLNRPHQTNLLHDIQDISVSEKHAAFITQDGSLYSYGLNLDGRLGIAAKSDLKLPINNATKIKLNARAVKVKCGFSHVCVKLSNEELYAWGLGDYGALGIGQFKSKSMPIRVLLKSKIQNFSCGAMHSGFIDYQGNIYTCGSNQYGQLGVNRPQKIATPIIVNFNHKAKQIECGVFYTILLTTKGQVYGMGNNKYGQLGIGHKVNECHPTIIKQLQNIVAIAAGYHSGAIDGEGSLYIWGSGSFGELLKPKKIVLPTALDQIYIRGFYGVAVTSNRLENKIYVWGNNTYGELGRGNFQSSKDPVELKQLQGVVFDKFACGVNFFLATTKDKKLSHIPNEDTLAIKNRFEYTSIDHSDNRNKSPLAYNSRTPYNAQVGGSTYRHSQGKNDPYLSKYRSPTRLQAVLQNEARLRSRSRQSLEAINQQIRRSRSRTRNYQQLFISLSADYQALLTRYNSLEDHLQLKNRTLAIQKQELSLIFQEQNQITASQNDHLKRQILIVKQKLLEAEINRSSASAYETQNVILIKNLNTELKSQNELLKNQNKGLTVRLQTAEEDLKLYSSLNKNDLRLLHKQSQKKKDMQILQEQNYQLAKEIRLLKQEFKTTINQLESYQEELTFKDGQIKGLKQRIQSYRSQLLDFDSRQSKQAEILAKELKGLRQQFKSTVRKCQEAEQELAIKNLECRDLRQKKSAFDYRQEFQTSQKQLDNLAKDFKQQKQELKVLSRRYNELQQELAIKNIDLKDLKKKKDLLENELKQQNVLLSQQLTYLSKQLKITKEELKITLKKLDSQEDQMLDKVSQLKYVKQSKIKLNNKEVQLDALKTQCNALTKQTKQLKDSLKKTFKELNIFQQSQQASSAQITVLKKEIKNKNEEIKLLEKRLDEAEVQQYGSWKSKEKQLQRKLENQFNKTIYLLEDEKSRLNKINQKLQLDKRALEEILQEKQQKIIQIDRQFQRQIVSVSKNNAAFIQVQDLNNLRANELKVIIQNDKKLKNQMNTELDLLRMQSQNLIQEKKQLFKMIDELKNHREEHTKVYKDKIAQLENGESTFNERYQQLEVQLNYEKQYHKKCQYSIKELTDNRDKICKQNQIYGKELQKEKQKIKEMAFEIQKNKTMKKEIQVLNLQLQRVQTSTKQYRKQIQQVLAQKQQIVKELKNDLQHKQKQVDRWQQKYDQETGSLNRQIKDWQKKYSQKQKDYNEAKREVERRLSQIENLKDALEKIQRKLAFKNEELQKQSKEHQKTSQQFNNLRRQYTRLRSEKQDLENKIQELKDEKKILQAKFHEKKKEIQVLQGEIKRHQANQQNLRKENEIHKKELQQSNWALEQSNRVNDELQRANKQFAENQEQFTEKISHLEGRIFELEDQNKSYTPRYQVLMQRNKELDERNRQLSQMINKAIEIQAGAYKTNILKEVEINTGEIIQQIKEQQEFKYKGRRKEHQSRSPSKAEIDNIQAISEIKAAKVKEDPYSKMVNQKITIHKKKISDSAQKLAGILELNGKNEGFEMNDKHSDGKSFSRSMNARKQQDYQKINNQMQSLNNQKHEFMQKISSFAEKLKIL